MTAPVSIDDVYSDYELLEPDDRYRLLIDLGRSLEPMPDALKTDATLVRGCSASVWVYPVRREDGTLHFLADSNAAITKGIVALVLLAVQDRSPEEILATDVEAALAPFKARPHWGKVFLADAASTGRLYERLPDFTRLVDRLDPRGAFSNDWLSARVLGRQ